ncbi:MAG: hypothetical protein AAF823_15590 [Planctomycetota bacterium]
MISVDRDVKPVGAGLVGRLMGWRPQGEGTEYVPSTADHHGFGVRWRVVDRAGVLTVEPGLDLPVLAIALLGFGALIGGIGWAAQWFGAIGWVVTAIFTLVGLSFVVVLIVSPRALAADGPALRLERRGDRLTLNGNRAGTSATIERIECVAFVVRTPGLNRRGQRSGAQYSWGAHLVVVRRDGDPRHVPIACVGSNLKRAGRRLAAALGVPYAWTHLGVLKVAVD